MTARSTPAVLPTATPAVCVVVNGVGGGAVAVWEAVDVAVAGDVVVACIPTTASRVVETEVRVSEIVTVPVVAIILLVETVVASGVTAMEELGRNGIKVLSSSPFRVWLGLLKMFVG